MNDGWSPTWQRIAARDGVSLAVATYEVDDPVAVALVLHGLFSHTGWYVDLARGLAAHGIATWMLDRRGAGRSGGTRGHMDRWRQLASDVLLVSTRLRERHPGLPAAAIGVSLGATVGWATELERPGSFDRLVLLSPGLAPLIKLPLSRKLNLLRRTFVDPRQTYELPFTAAQLTDREAWQRALWNDPLRTHRVTARFLVELFKMQRYLRTKARHTRAPILALLAERDQLVDNGVTERTLRQVSPPVEVDVYVDASHVLAACVDGASLVERIAEWMVMPGQPGEPMRWRQVTVGVVEPQPPSLAAERAD